MKKIAVYGKGGIGKSTFAANISACIAESGVNVLQIGCDPKHDSTQILCGRAEPLLDILLEKGSGLTESDFLKEGTYGVKCIEIGGPKPGVGCAGRGIIRGIDVINKMDIINRHSIDLCIYDVLGDVVCGGFFEPIRRGGTDELYIVTSGEFNSLFAANNICAGFVNSVPDNGKTVVAGMIGNLRGIRNERMIIESFADKIGVPLIGIIPRDDRIERSTVLSTPIISSDDTEDLKIIFRTIADKIINCQSAPLTITPFEFSELKEMHQKINLM